MGRDWTPRETYLVEQHDLETKTGIGSIWDFMASATWVIDGKSISLHSAEEVALRKQYPVLGKFLESFNDLYSKLSQFEGGLELLKQKDDELASYIETGNGDKNSYLVKWFEGELDEHFYYRERNDELFVSAICKEAIEKGLNNWIITDPDCVQVRRQVGFEGRGVFELLQINEIPDESTSSKSFYLVADGEIDFDDFTQDEINSALDGFGYDNMKDLVRAAGSENEAYGQLAEMLFELSTSFGSIQFCFWDEALNHIANRTGLDLDSFRESQSINISGEEMKVLSDRAAARMRIKAKEDFRSLDEQIEVCSAKADVRPPADQEIDKER